MNTEVSAGGIIVYKASRSWRVLVMKDQSGNWTFPKGKIEKGEDLLDTATREIEEEVGLNNLIYVAELSPTSYWYFRKKSIKKTVHYFLFRSETMQTPHVQTEEGISEAQWVEWKKAERMIGYPKTNVPLLEQAYTKLPGPRKA